LKLLSKQSNHFCIATFFSTGLFITAFANMKTSTVTNMLALTGPALGATIAPRAIWQPAVGTTWQIVLTGQININDNTASIVPNVDVFDIDLFFNTKDGTDPSVIRNLHRLGKKVICYFSGGSYEPDRPDSDDFPEADKGNVMIGWEDEKWLNLRSTKVRDIMKARIALAKDMGCDAIDPDNMDGYAENKGVNPGFTLTQDDSIDFVKFLATEAHAKDLAIGLKNAGEIIGKVIDDVQFSVNEECASEHECGVYKQFVDNTKLPKPVFHIEYPNESPSSHVPVTDTAFWCTRDTENNVDFSKFSTVIKNLDLDGWVQLCNKAVSTTPTKEPSA
jgi:hypothetical protein